MAPFPGLLGNAMQLLMSSINWKIELRKTKKEAKGQRKKLSEKKGKKDNALSSCVA
jgi:hypothetical protein